QAPINYKPAGEPTENAFGRHTVDCYRATRGIVRADNILVSSEPNPARVDVFGVCVLAEGTRYFEGAALKFLVQRSSVKYAFVRGTARVHPHPMLKPSLRTADNPLIACPDPVRDRPRKAASQGTQEILRRQAVWVTWCELQLAICGAH